MIAETAYLALSIVSLMFIVMLAFRLYRLQNQLENSNKLLVREIRVFTRSLSNVSKRIAEMEKHFSDVAVTQKDMVKLNTETNQNAYYKQATEMLRIGASLDEVIKVCGITHAEAELLCQLHKKKAPTNLAVYER